MGPGRRDASGVKGLVVVCGLTERVSSRRFRGVAGSRNIARFSRLLMRFFAFLLRHAGSLYHTGSASSVLNSGVVLCSHHTMFVSNLMSHVSYAPLTRASGNRKAYVLYVHPAGGDHQKQPLSVKKRRSHMF